MSAEKVLVGWKIIHHHKDVENTFGLSGLESEDQAVLARIYGSSIPFSA